MSKNDDLASKIFKRVSKEERRMIKALIDAGEALPDWLLQSEGEPPDDIYATKGASKRYPKGWAEEFMSDEEKKKYREKISKKKGGLVVKNLKKGGKVRGVRIAKKGFRPAKMR